MQQAGSQPTPRHACDLQGLPPNPRGGDVGGQQQQQSASHMAFNPLHLEPSVVHTLRPKPRAQQEAQQHQQQGQQAQQQGQQAQQQQAAQHQLSKSLRGRKNKRTRDSDSDYDPQEDEQQLLQQRQQGQGQGQATRSSRRQQQQTVEVNLVSDDEGEAGVPGPQQLEHAGMRRSARSNAHRTTSQRFAVSAAARTSLPSPSSAASSAAAASTVMSTTVGCWCLLMPVCDSRPAGGRWGGVEP